MKIISAIFAISLFRFTQGAVQEILAYSNNNYCYERDRADEQITKPITVLPEDHWISQNGSALQIVGIWKTTSMGVFEGGASAILWELFVQPSEDFCLEKSDWYYAPDYNSFERIGPADTSTSQLNLFSSQSPFYYPRKEYVVTEDTPQLHPLGDTVKIESLAHFSNESWILYSANNYQGRRRCLCPVDEDGELLPVDGFYATVISNGAVASVRKDLNNDCDCFSVQETKNRKEFKFLSNKMTKW